VGKTNTCVKYCIYSATDGDATREGRGSLRKQVYQAEELLASMFVGWREQYLLTWPSYEKWLKELRCFWWSMFSQKVEKDPVHLRGPLFLSPMVYQRWSSQGDPGNGPGKAWQEKSATDQSWKLLDAQVLFPDQNVFHTSWAS